MQRPEGQYRADCTREGTSGNLDQPRSLSDTRTDPRGSAEPVRERSRPERPSLAQHLPRFRRPSEERLRSPILPRGWRNSRICRGASSVATCRGKDGGLIPRRPYLSLPYSTYRASQVIAARVGCVTKVFLSLEFPERWQDVQIAMLRRNFTSPGSRSASSVPMPLTSGIARRLSLSLGLAFAVQQIGVRNARMKEKAAEWVHSPIQPS
jgi:hypothetical protein